MNIIKAFWNFLGTSTVWLVVFSIIVVSEAIGGQTLKGMFYSFICLMVYFLQRIAEAVEKNQG